MTKTEQQQRVLGRILAQTIKPEEFAILAAEAAGGKCVFVQDTNGGQDSHWIY